LFSDTPIGKPLEVGYLKSGGVLSGDSSLGQCQVGYELTAD